MKNYLAPIVAAGLVAGAGAGALAISPVSAQTTTSVSSSPTSTPPTRPFFGGFGGGIGFGMISPDRIDAQAQLLGITSDDLLARVIKGEKLSDILKDLNITQANLTAKIKARHDQQLTDLKTKVQALVTAGTITQAQADAYLTRLTTPPKMPAFKGGMGHGGFRGMHRPAAPTTPAPST